jgi:hypothetical protein
MTKLDAPLDRRAFLSTAAGGGAYAALGGLGVTNLFKRWPLESGSARPFEIVVIGDSIMFGQGLSDDPAKNQKFTFKMQKFVQEKLPGTEVHLHNFAHSGAQILADVEEDAKPADHGEIPNNFPSITWQLGRAVTELSGGVQRRYVPNVHPMIGGESVDLVLVDGGINDFGTKKFLDPTIALNPFDHTSGVEWVRKITREQCIARMQTLLPKVMTAFPNAKIVVTNYFQIVSDQSDPVYLFELLRFWDIIGEAMELTQSFVMKKLTAQSMAFHDELTRGLRTVVAEARPLQVVASAASTKVVQSGAQGGLTLGTPTPRRVALAEVKFGPENAYAAPDTHLFYLNEPDPAASVRKPVCLAKYGVLNPNCAMAASGHPNLKGAQVYADAIIASLKQLFPEWGTSKTDVRTAQPIALPGVRPIRPPARRP